MQAQPPLRFPLLDLRAQYAGIRDEVEAAVLRVLESQQFILGPEVEQFEKEIAEFLDVHFAVSCASGSDALLLALMALEVGPGDEVVTTPFTFGATAAAILRCGARARFVDIDPETWNLDARLLPHAISSRTRAIIPIHLFGLAADMHDIVRIAVAHGVAVVEDAAQAIGARYRGRAVGGLGNVGCFSFYPSKNLAGAGDGGLATTSDPMLADRLRVLRSDGMRRRYEYEMLGLNSRLDALQAAMLRVKLRHLPEWTEARQRNAERYRALFAAEGLDQYLALPRPSPECAHVYNQFVVRAPERDQLRAHLRASGIPTEVYYP